MEEVDFQESYERKGERLGREKGSSNVILLLLPKPSLFSPVIPTPAVGWGHIQSRAYSSTDLKVIGRQVWKGP